MSATDFPNVFHLRNGRLVPSASLFSSVSGAVRAAASTNSSDFVKRACVCGRDEIETVYCLRVVIETLRIEVPISVATLALLKSALASHARSARFPASTIYDVDCCSVRVNADRTSDRLRTPSNFLRSWYSPSRSLSCREGREHRGLWPARGREPNAVANHFDPSQPVANACEGL